MRRPPRPPSRPRAPDRRLGAGISGLMLRTALVLAFLVPYGLVACPLAVLLSLATGSVAPLYGFSTFGLRCAFAIAGIRIEIVNRDKLADIRNTVLAANHLSHLDPPAIYVGMGVPLVAL